MQRTMFLYSAKLSSCPLDIPVSPDNPGASVPRRAPVSAVAAQYSEATRPRR